jgi:uncharacterized membrane protein
VTGRSPLRRAARKITQRSNLLIAAIFAVIVWLASQSIMVASTGLVTALDAGGVLFLVLTAFMVFRATAQSTQQRAQELDEGEIAMVVLTLCAGAVSLAAVFLEARAARALGPTTIVLHLMLAAGSIVVAWLVTHTLFGLHYAHLYYSDLTDRPMRGGLQFSGGEPPDYWDFLYFSFVIGMTCQTSDTGVTERHFRRLSLLHGVVSFFFNTVILAMAINIAAGLLQPAAN